MPLAACGRLFQPPKVQNNMEKSFNDMLERLIALDNGGRRSGGDRRNYSYTLHIPERRNGMDRRSGDDRRKIQRKKTKPQEQTIKSLLF
jgi:hypothetical protein